MTEEFKFEVFIRTESEDWTSGYSHFWNATSFAEAEKKSLPLLVPGEFIYKIEKDF